MFGAAHKGLDNAGGGLSIHETVQLIVMHATHTVTPLVRLKCRGNTVQSKERGRKRENEKKVKSYKLQQPRHLCMRKYYSLLH